MRTVAIAVRNETDFIDLYREDLAGGGVFIPEQYLGPVGSRVAVEIAFRRSEVQFNLTGMVRAYQPMAMHWREELRRKPGALIAFDWDEADCVARLLSHVRESSAAVQVRKDDGRQGISVEVDFSGQDQSVVHRAQVTNISSGGIFVRSRYPFRVGTRLQLKLREPNHAFSKSARGEVAWVSHSTENPGMGVRFVCLDRREQRDLRRAVGKLQSFLSSSSITE